MSKAPAVNEGCQQTKNPTAQQFPDGPEVKNLPSNAGDKGSTSGQRSKIPHASGQLGQEAGRKILKQITEEPTYHN